MDERGSPAFDGDSLTEREAVGVAAGARDGAEATDGSVGATPPGEDA